MSETSEVSGMSRNMSNGKTNARNDRWHAVTVHRDGNNAYHINSRDYRDRDWTLVGAWYLRVENDVVVRARGLDNTPRQVYVVCRGGAMRNAGGEYTLEAVKRKLRDGTMEIH